jgi:uncharacterized protein involved in response to NO
MMITRFFSYGFRPFFLLAGLYAALLIPIWLLALTGTPWSATIATGIGWHAHEMYFGFVAAAVAGFLLTAVANWTGRPPVRGWPLFLLVLAWLLGRIGWNTATVIPAWLLVTADLIFPLLLIAMIAREVLLGRNLRNLVVVAAAALFFCGSLLIDLDMLGLGGDLQQRGQHLAGDAIILVIVIIGGRIVPAFTRNALARRGDGGALPVSWLPIDILAIASVAAFVVARQLPVDETAVGIVAAVAAVANAIRLALWRGWRTAGAPILWILHVAYLWIPIGLALLAIAMIADAIPASAGTHALGAGAAATMILAVTTRAALGHTGRPLVAGRAITAAYILLTLGATARVVALLIPGRDYLPALEVAGTGWTLAFALFVVVYAPILLGPRADDEPG